MEAEVNSPPLSVNHSRTTPPGSLCFHFLIKCSKQSLTSPECFDLSRYISLHPVAESTNDKMYLYPKVTLGGNSPHKSECIRSPKTFGWNCCGISCKGRLRAPPRRQPSQCSCRCLTYRGVSGSPIERDRARSARCAEGCPNLACTVSAETDWIEGQSSQMVHA